MPADVDISVIIPCYNAERWISETLESVFSQKAGRIEVIVVDDGSTDGSARLVREKFPSARLLAASAGEKGPARARNAGMGQASGRWIQFLDADDLLAPGKLEKQAVALKESSGDVAYGDWRKLIMKPDGSSVLEPPVVNRLRDPETDLVGGVWAPLASYLFRRETALAAGPFRQDMVYIDDASFLIDCAVHGSRFVYCPGIQAHYRVHPAGSQSTRNRAGWVADCLRLAEDVEQTWRSGGGLTPARTVALSRAYDHACRAAVAVDDKMFDRAFKQLMSLNPSYLPEGSPRLAAISRLVGYKRALKISHILKKLTAA